MIWSTLLHWIPNKYNNYGTIKEYTECRNNVVMMDLSSLRKFEILGPDAEELLNIALTRNIKNSLLVKLCTQQCVMKMVQ